MLKDEYHPHVYQTKAKPGFTEIPARRITMTREVSLHSKGYIFVDLIMRNCPCPANSGEMDFSRPERPVQIHTGVHLIRRNGTRFGGARRFKFLLEQTKVLKAEGTDM